MKSQADPMEVVQPRIRCTRIRTLKAGWPSTLTYLVRPHKTAKVTSMEVKVDPGAEASLMPVCHFRRLFPQLCLNGQPKEGVLQKADSRFESYSGDSVQIQGHITFQVQNIQTRRYRPIRFYVNNRESGPVLLGHAACHWLGMITVQCFNKARVHKKFIASVSKDGPERSSSSDKKLQSR